MRAAGYIRVSTEEQAREGYGLSAQRQAVQAYCLAHGWEIAEVYEDAGISGKSRKGRESLGRLMDDARAGAFDRLIFWKLDRLARNLKDLLEICDQLEAVDVGIVSIQESIDTGTAAGRMVRSFLGAVAEFERDTIVDRIKAGLAEKARQGEILGELPLGYERVDGEVVVVPELAPLIRAAFEHYAGGSVSMRDMALWAAGVGLRSPRGNPIDRLYARKMLSNPTYAGMVTHKGQVVVAKGQHPAIVDLALFTTVQERIKDRNRHFPSTRPFGKEPYPLSGTAVCDHCGTGILGASKAVRLNRTGDETRTYAYYRCSTTHRHGKQGCEQPMVRTYVLEDQIASYVGGMRLPPDYLGEVVAELRRRAARPDQPQERRGLRQQLERWRRLFVLEEIGEARLKTETAPLKARLAEIERPSEVLDVEAAVNCLRDMGKLWAESPRDQQRTFVREVFQRIGVAGKTVSAITPKALYAPLFVIDRRERFGGDNDVLHIGSRDRYPDTPIANQVPRLIVPSSAVLVPA